MATSSAPAKEKYDKLLMANAFFGDIKAAALKARLLCNACPPSFLGIINQRNGTCNFNQHIENRHADTMMPTYNKYANVSIAISMCFAHSLTHSFTLSLLCATDC
jgi:hypothetical protein